MANHSALTTLALPTAALELLAVTLLATSSGCTLWQREPNHYADVLTELFETRTEATNACYDRYLSEVDPSASGKLVLAFEVTAKTGALTGLDVVEDQSTVPPALAACVSDEIAGLKVDPPDVNTARATFTWEFNLGARKGPPPDPFAVAQKTILSCYSAHLAEVDREATGTIVIDYTLDRDAGTLERLEIVAAETTAPAPVIECAMPSLEAAALAPENVTEHNASGRRSFALRYKPYDAP